MDMKVFVVCRGRWPNRLQTFAAMSVGDSFYAIVEIFIIFILLYHAGVKLDELFCREGCRKGATGVDTSRW